MSWKNLPYWLKGGIITSILALIFFIYYLFTVRLCFDYVDGSCDLLIKTLFVGSINYSTYLSLIGALIVSFIISALIGFVYGKLKNKA